MKYVRISPSRLNGEIEVPPSKSISHRALICAGLSDGISFIKHIEMSEDITATCRALESLGVKIQHTASALVVEGVADKYMEPSMVDCAESGSTLRFMIPIMAALGKPVTFKGKGKLVERPLKSYYRIFDEQELEYTTIEGMLPLTINGKLKPGVFKLEGNVSSQFISGLLFALPLLDGDSRIEITTPVESRPYIDLTIDALTAFGIQIENHDYKMFIVKGNQKYQARDLDVEGDFSQAAFWLAAGLLGRDIECLGLNLESLQGDKRILDILNCMGGGLFITDNMIKAVSSNTSGYRIDAAQCPDLVPVLAVLASVSVGRTEIVNAGRLRIKESDRLHAICTELRKIGADIEEKEDGLVIKGQDNLKGGTVQSWNDHRIAMALAVASIKCREPLIIKDADCVRKSYPDFWDDFKKLGGHIDEWCMGE